MTVTSSQAVGRSYVAQLKCVLTSLNALQQLPRLPYERSNLPALFNRCFPVQAVLERVLITPRCARSRRAAMHATSLLAMHRRRLAGRARASLGATARARQHRAGIARVIAGHLAGLRLNGTEVGAGSPTVFIAGPFGSARACGNAAAWVGPVARGVCVTLPTMAWPPSLTETC